jgi:hypothetical protein
MKALILLFTLLMVTSAVAQEHQAESAVDWVLSLNPLILIIAGIVLFFASGLAKIIAILLVLVGAASLILSMI